MTYLLINFIIETFYLECCVKPNAKVESKELNEQMFLVVRSLKHNNAKIVTYSDIKI